MEDVEKYFRTRFMPLVTQKVSRRVLRLIGSVKVILSLSVICVVLTWQLWAGLELDSQS